MRVYKSREIARALKKKGFEERRDGHHVQYFLRVGGRRTSVYTYLSHNNQEYQRRTLSELRSQLGLDDKEFDGLVQCPLGHDEYVRILRSKNRLI